ncbi:MAG: serine protein kinase RIO [Candidatus Diapherotrites archaeon]|nr:serine protein kinase RIO [Candidatus Diapherotrites archaeon]
MDVSEFEKRLFVRKEEEREKDREQRKIMEDVFDNYTAESVMKLIARGYIDGLQYCVSKGKEANVFRAVTRGGKARACKIYRVETSDFKAMWKYLEGDRRFENVKHNRRQIVLAWCQKEFKNLQIAYEAKCNVPKPYAYFRNALVMEFIGGEYAAPLLKDAAIENLEKTFWKIIEDVKTLLKNDLVHGDLSEFNILYWNEQPYIIDMGQAVLVSHPNADEFLERDIRNLCKFFKKRGYETKPEEILKYVRGG